MQALAADHHFADSATAAREANMSKAAQKPALPRQAPRTRPGPGARSDVKVFPLTPARWDDLVELFGPNGACAGCWCMWWRLTQTQFNRDAGAANRKALKEIVDEGRVPGLLAYLDGKPVGWCSVAPREEYGRVVRSRTLRSVDDQPVWSIVCFYIDRAHRKRGVAKALIESAVNYASKRGAKIVEGYPLDPDAASVTSSSAYVGTLPMFREAGFDEVARRSKGRPIMRRGSL